MIYTEEARATRNLILAVSHIMTELYMLTLVRLSQ